MKITADQVVAQARSEYETLHSLPIADPDERERFYREHVEGSLALRRLKQAMDEWCAVWFWPADEESLRHVPTPLRFHQPCEQAALIVERLASEVRFFHWELEFPDVFTPQRSGFDAVLGNPPWENSQPNPYEFFARHEPLIRTFGRLEALRKIEELFGCISGLEDQWHAHCGFFKAFSNWVANAADPFGLDEDSGALGRGAAPLVVAWKKRCTERQGFVGPCRPFRYQTGRVFTYKLFLESSHFLTTMTGRLGMIVPSGLYTDAWSLPLRELFLEQSQWEWLFSFENKRRIFDIHSSFKFAPVIVSRHRPAARTPLKAAFMVHDLSAWERPNPPVINFDPALTALFAPRSKSLPEIRNPRDFDICRKVYDHSFRIGDNAPGWEITFALEFMMNTDAKLFPPREKWEAKRYQPDVFGRWIGPDGDVALPLYEGVMVGQLDPPFKVYRQPIGARAGWFSCQSDHKQFVCAFQNHP
jgi:hypothetical protein